MFQPVDDGSVWRGTLRLDAEIRPCRAEDVAMLEWYGMFSHHREIIEATFEKHRRGDALMLVADVNGFAAGQVWLDLVSLSDQRGALLWALRVLPPLQGAGLGTRLMESAEDAVRRGGYEWVELSVEHWNTGAQRLYERRGYRSVERGHESGLESWVPREHRIMRKLLAANRR